MGTVNTDNICCMFATFHLIEACLFLFVILNWNSAHCKLIVHIWTQPGIEYLDVRRKAWKFAECNYLCVGVKIV